MRVGIPLQSWFFLLDLFKLCNFCLKLRKLLVHPSGVLESCFLSELDTSFLSLHERNRRFCWSFHRLDLRCWFSITLGFLGPYVPVEVHVENDEHTPAKELRKDHAHRVRLILVMSRRAVGFSDRVVAASVAEFFLEIAAVDLVEVEGGCEDSDFEDVADDDDD